MEKKLYSLRGGLKKARKRKGIKQSDLADLMGVTLKTVMNWEQGIVNPDFGTVMKLADKLNCDIDYLCGRLSESTHDIHFVHEFTGLSEEAINKIACPELNHPIGKLLSRLIEAERFENLITTYGIFAKFLDKLKADDLDDPSPWLSLSDSNVVLGTNQAINHFKQEATRAMSNLCDSEHMTKLSHLEKKKNTFDLDSAMRELHSIENEIAYLTEEKEFYEKEILPELRESDNEEKE